MKKNLIAVAVLASSTFAMSAFAADGQINFTGEIIDTACTVTNDPANPLSVTLGNVASTSFDAVGDTAASTKFDLLLTGCPDTVSTSATVKFDGNPAANNNEVLELTQGVGVATGVGIQLADDTGTTVPLFTASKPYALQTGDNTLSFMARYISTAAVVTPGTANSTAQFTIIYN